MSKVLTLLAVFWLSSSAFADGDFLQVNANLDTATSHKLIAAMRGAHLTPRNLMGQIAWDISGIRCEGQGLIEKSGPIYCPGQEFPFAVTPQKQSSSKNKALVSALSSALSSVKIVNQEAQELSLRDLMSINSEGSPVLSTDNIVVQCIYKVNWGIANTCMVSGRFYAQSFKNTDISNYECKSKSPSTFCRVGFTPQYSDSSGVGATQTIN